MTGREWDAASYDSVGSPMTKMALAVLDRLPLAGSEVVLDAGCGTGRVSALVRERVPDGRVISVDADPDMVRVAVKNLGPEADVRQVNLLEFDLGEQVDAVLSTATFHWIPDHPTLFTQLFRALRPGGKLVAQCGGEGNIAEVRETGDTVAGEPPFSEWFDDWSAPWYYAGPDLTAKRLRAAGFEDVKTWLQPWPVRSENPKEYLSTIVLGAQVQRLPEALRERYTDEVLSRLSTPVEIGYVRLNIDATKPA